MVITGDMNVIDVITSGTAETSHQRTATTRNAIHLTGTRRGYARMMISTVFPEATQNGTF